MIVKNSPTDAAFSASQYPIAVFALPSNDVSNRMSSYARDITNEITAPASIESVESNKAIRASLVITKTVKEGGRNFNIGELSRTGFGARQLPDGWSEKMKRHLDVRACSERQNRLTRRYS